MRRKRLLFLAMVALWFLVSDRNVEAVAHQCNSIGVDQQDNFIQQGGLSGWYCNSSGTHARDLCMDEVYVNAACSGNCNICGGDYTGAWTCGWQPEPPGQPGDQLAQAVGCNSSQYGQKYRLSCICDYPIECGGHHDSCGVENNFCCQEDYVCATTEQGDICLEPGESPILLDLDSNTANYDLTSVDEGVQFDINADGSADRVAWTRAGTNVGFLAIDRNGNRSIDDGSELFGNFTPTSNGQVAANGFVALRDLDQNQDGRVDSADAAYSQLVIWTDLNHDGRSQSDELQSLVTAGVTVLFNEYHESRRVDRNGNSYRYVGTALVRRNGRDQPRRIFDVYLRLD
jgi:hypothetical protein